MKKDLIKSFFLPSKLNLISHCGAKDFFLLSLTVQTREKSAAMEFKLRENSF
jgi:hypothetical protein